MTVYSPSSGVVATPRLIEAIDSSSCKKGGFDRQNLRANGAAQIAVDEKDIADVPRKPKGWLRASRLSGRDILLEPLISSLPASRRHAKTTGTAGEASLLPTASPVHRAARRTHTHHPRKLIITRCC